jgi:hypothetical protein
MFDPERVTSYRDIKDGSAQAIAIVEAKRSIPWTKPEDILFVNDEAPPKFGGVFPGGFHVLFLNGNVHFLSDALDPAVVHALATLAGGEEFTFDRDTNRLKLKPPDAASDAEVGEAAAKSIKAPSVDEILAIVKASDIRLELRQLQANYDKLDTFIHENPDRVTPEIKLAHQYLGQRMRTTGSEIARHPELLLVGEERKTTGVDKEPESERVEVRHAKAALGVALDSLKHLEAARRTSSEAVTPVELSRSRRNVWLAKLSLVDVESDAAAPSESKDTSPGIRRAKAREAFLRQQSTNKLKLIGIGLQAYHNAYKHFPPAVVIGPDGKTPHSWRVALLPFFEGEARKLYERYRLNEPWDSEHNKALIPEGAAFYSVPSEALSEDCGYYVLTGPGTAFDPEKNTTMRMIVDGMAWTMGVIEAKRDIPWTRPEDIPYAPEAPLPAFGGFFDGGFNAVFMDGAAHFLPSDMDEPTLRALITKAGRESMRVDRSTGRLTVSSPPKAKD